MNRSPLIATLPEHLQADAVLSGGNVSWPLTSIPLVIEAYRSAGMINRGGDLQVVAGDSTWESPNIGVWVFDSELVASGSERADEAASVALSKIAALDREALRAEATAGCPFFTGGASALDSAVLRLTWRAEPKLLNADSVDVG